MSPAEVRREAWKLKQEGRYAEALSLLAPVAADARRGEDRVVAMDLTDDEANYLLHKGEHAAALARATWCISVANDPAHVEALQGDRGARSVARAFRTWGSVALESEHLSPDDLWPMLDAFEATLTRLDRAAWSWNIDHLRGNLHRKLGDHEQAIPALVRAIEGALRAPDSPGVTVASLRRSLSWSLRRVGREEEAIAQLKAVIQDPKVARFDLVTANIYLAQTLVKLERFEEAAPVSDRAVEGAESLASPQQLAAWGSAVEAWLGAGRLQDAERAAARVVDLARESGRSDDLFGAHQDSFDVAMARDERASAAAHLQEMARHLARIERRRPDQWRRRALEARRERLQAAEEAP